MTIQDSITLRWFECQGMTMGISHVCVPLHSEDAVKRVSITIKPFRNQFNVSLFYQGLNLIVP